MTARRYQVIAIVMAPVVFYVGGMADAYLDDGNRAFGRPMGWVFGALVLAYAVFCTLGRRATRGMVIGVTQPPEVTSDDVEAAWCTFDLARIRGVEKMQAMRLALENFADRTQAESGSTGRQP